MVQESREQQEQPTAFIPFVDWRAAATIFVLTLIAYVRCHNNSFINLDDPTYITENPLVKDLTWSNLYKIWTNVDVRPYYPTVFTLYAVEYAIWGHNPAAFHSVNVVLHALNAVLAYVLILRMFRSQTVGLVTGLLLGLHPLHVSAVAWASNTKEILSCLFVLLTLLAYHKYAVIGRPRYYGMSLVFYTFALLSKMASALLPLLLFIVDYHLRRHNRRLEILEKIPYLHVAIVLGFITWNTHVVPSVSTGGQQVSFYSQTNAFCALGFYVLKLLLPVNMSVIYPSEYSTLATGVMAYATIAFVATTIWVLMLSRNYGFGLAWFGLLAAPILGFVPFGYVVRVAPFASHFVYLVDIGLFVVVGLIARAILVTGGGRRRKQALIAVMAIIGGLLSLQTSQRCNVFQNSENFWRDAIKGNQAPNSSVGHLGLSRTLADAGRLEEALYHAEIAESRAPANEKAGVQIEKLRRRIEDRDTGRPAAGQAAEPPDKPELDSSRQQ